MSFKNIVRGVVTALFVALPALAQAQVAGGNITGTATDEQGGVMPGVTVTLKGADLTRTFVTEAAGRYRFLDLAPGLYTVTSELDGFATNVRADVVLDVGKTVDLPVKLKVGRVTETVTVTAASPIVDAKQTGTTTNVTADELANIPTSRDPFSLMRSVPGVLVDRVNIGGNETGQQSNFVSKGSRPQDAVWTLDGVTITDMALTGAAPTYFNYDNFDAIHVSTAGQAITQQTGGLGLDFVVKRGTNLFHGAFRGYFDNEKMESSNVPAELLARGVTSATADHNKQISDYGGDLGGPLMKDKAWFYGSYSVQDVQLVRRAGNLVDRTQLKNPNVKVNWQATKNDTVSFLYFDGFKVKDNRSPGTSGITFDAQTATFHQDNAYTDFPLHGLWKIANDRVISPNMFLSAKYAYYNTGFVLTPEGGMDLQAGRNLITAQSFGSTVQSLNLRPQMTANVDLNSFFSRLGAVHNVSYGFGWRRVNATTGTLWPGNGVLAVVQNASTSFAQVFREGSGTNHTSYLDFYAGDTIAWNRATIDIGIRYDRQGGRALPSVTAANTALPTVVPGLNFAGYEAPFVWNNISPRVGLTYALDDARKTLARASYSRFAGQLDSGSVGYMNPSSTAGVAVYRWLDVNGDHFAQADEVQLNQFLGTAGGFNRNDPTAVVSANRINPDLKAPTTQSVVIGLDRELRPNFGLQVNYTYAKTTNLIGNGSWAVTPRVGVALTDYTAGPTLTGTLPDGSAYSVPTFIPDQAKVVAGGSGFLLTNWNGFYTDYHGVEVSAVKRLSNRWMGRVGLSFNNAREHYAPEALYDTNGNPTRTTTEPLVDGGQFAPRIQGNGGGDVYINARWQFNANGLYQAPYGIELAANVFGRQGYPFPMFRTQTLGADTGLQILVTPKIDSFRYDNVWDTDLRVGRTFKLQAVSLRVMGDLFNAFNANTALLRNDNILSTSFNVLSQNLSPRILRVGVVIGF
jgi:Carboxypeptidase regulatory-like domain/TonB-dependent Receptor Plug Domain